MIPFPYIMQDKLAHFFWSYIALIVAIPFVGLWLASIALVCFAAWKELWHDGKLKKGKKEFLDFAFSCLPILLSWINTNTNSLHLINQIFNIL